MFPSALLSLAIAIVLQLSDTVIAGIVLHDEKALGAIGLCSTALIAALFVGTIITRGSGIAYNVEIGKGNKKGADIIFTQGLVISCIFSLLLVGVFTFGKGLYFDILGADDPDTVEYALGYYKWYAFTYGTFPFLCFFNEMDYADGDSRIVTISSVSMVFVNIGASYLLATAGGMGIEGLGLGSLIGYGVGTLIMVLHVFNRRCTFRFCFKFSWTYLKQVLRNSVVDAIASLFIALFTFVLNIMTIEAFGDIYLPVTSVIIQLIQAELIFDGVGQAMSPFVSVYRGENNNKLCKHSFNVSLSIALVLGVSASVLFAVLAKPFAMMLGITSDFLMDKTVLAIRIICSTMTFNCLMYLFSSYYVIDNRPGLGVMCSFIKDFLLPAALGAASGLIFLSALGTDAGLTAFWAGCAAGYGISVPVLWLIVRIKYGKKKFPLIQQENGIVTESFDCLLTQENAMDARDFTFDFCDRNKIGGSSKMLAGLIVEEMYGIILKENEKKVSTETTVVIDGDVLRLYIRNTGELQNRLDPDALPDSIGRYCMDKIIESKVGHQYSITNGNNRYVFDIKK